MRVEGVQEGTVPSAEEPLVQIRDSLAQLTAQMATLNASVASLGKDTKQLRNRVADLESGQHSLRMARHHFVPQAADDRVPSGGGVDGGPPSRPSPFSQ